uniref:Glycosyltransferase family 92 protein n=1 Tax=Panagrellus redivivus TaxID=6233 RepID=A0A7E4V894_PANRE
MGMEMTSSSTSISTQKPPAGKAVPENVFFVKSVYYYNTSTIYPNNTAIILFFGNLPGPPNNWHCITKNINNTINVAEAEIKPLNDITPASRWKVQTAKCEVVENALQMNFIALADPFSNIALTTEEPIREPRGLVACFEPMFYETRWQGLIIASELYAKWGVELQVHYVHSSVGDILNLLEPFVIEKLMEIQPLNFPFIDKITAAARGFDIAETIKTLALQDCFLRYRESATFIITGDVEEMFIPMNKGSLFDEFQFLSTLAPTAPAIAAVTAFGRVYTADMVEDFSLESTLYSITFENRNVPGNLVYNPKFAETPWIDFQSIFNASIDSNITNIHLHYVYDNTTFDGNKSINAPRLIDYIDLVVLFKPNRTIIDLPSVKAALNELPSYAESYQMMDMKSFPPRLEDCNNPDCEAPKQNFSCNIGIEHYSQTGGSLAVFIPIKGIEHKYVKLQSDGCVDNNNETF